jgi:hypothetical protein
MTTEAEGGKMRGRLTIQAWLEEQQRVEAAAKAKVEKIKNGPPPKQQGDWWKDA